MKRELQTIMQAAFPEGIMPTSLHRWLIFNTVGAIGFVVQLASLTFLTAVLRWSIVPATTLAVEIAVVHNFFWHEHWTWADREVSGWSSALRRFFSFNLSNGALSIAGNVIFTLLFLGTLPVNYLTANILAIAVCSILNYVVSDRLVFQAASAKAGREYRSACRLNNRHGCRRDHEQD